MNDVFRGLGLLALIFTPSALLLGPPVALIQTGHGTAGSIWLGVVVAGLVLFTAYSAGRSLND